MRSEIHEATTVEDINSVNCGDFIANLSIQILLLSLDLLFNTTIVGCWFSPCHFIYAFPK